MRPLDFVLLVGYAVALSLGQLLFKIAAPATKVPDFAAAVRGLLMSPAFVGGAVLYAGLMFFWTWLLGRVPLNYAYPIVALCFVLVPLMSWLFFGERAGPMYFVGFSIHRHRHRHHRVRQQSVKTPWLAPGTKTDALGLATEDDH